MFIFPQDDSDDELPSVKRAQARKKQRHEALFGSQEGDAVTGEDFIDLSCEEGEETSASSEVQNLPATLLLMVLDCVCVSLEGLTVYHSISKCHYCTAPGAF